MEWSLAHAGEEYTALAVDLKNTPTMSLADWYEVLYHCAAFLDLDAMVADTNKRTGKKAMARVYAQQLAQGGHAAREHIVNETSIRSRY